VSASQIKRHTPAFRRTTLALFASGFSTFSLMYCVQPLLPAFAREFQLTPAASSLAVSLTTGCLAIAMLIVGALSEARGRKPLMVTSLTLAALLTVVSALASSWPMFLLMRAAEGVMFAGLPAIAMAYVGEEMHPSAFGVAMGLYVAGTALGGMAGRLLTAVVSDHTSWRWAIATMGVIGLAAAAAVAVSLPRSVHFRARESSVAASAGAYLAQLRDPVLLMLFAEAFLILGAFVACYNYIGFRLTHAPYGYSQSRVGAVFLLYLVGTISSPWAGGLAQRIGRPRTLTAMLLLMFGGLLLTLVRPIAVVVAGIGALTFGFFAAHSVASSWVSMRAQERKAQASSLYLCCYYLGGSLAGTIGGLFWQRWDWPGVVAFLCALLTIGLVIVRALNVRAGAPAGVSLDVPPSPAGA
jgi:YNFM family putative membrane transporter